MLTDRDRTLLKPYVAMLRLARNELAAAQRAFDQAERDLAESSSGTDWRDRMLGGLFSADDSRTQRFRQARGGHRAAEKALVAAQARHAKYASQVDELLEPILAGNDPGFRSRRTAVLACDKALKACEDLLASARGSEAKPKDKDAAAFAKTLRDDFLKDLKTRGPAVKRLVERAASAVGEATGEPVGPVALEFDVRLNSRLNATIADLKKWRARADEVRAGALQQAHDEL
ncbi:hypothetical protein [Actinoplanes solisilvae]|uniref:hypothetical protein n=1 Tax=Actinoplanes solisilvae TaxID=2486853 RepID=UPI000FDAD069|nr:hypothetical protein [Actinoplanes solisilvae]